MRKNRVDVMTDIETLGTNSDSTIIQISAIAFDIRTGKHLQHFNQVADIAKNENPLKVTGATLKWWLDTNKELFSELVNGGGESSERVLRDFYNWLLYLQTTSDRDVFLWGNGILFDNKMIQHQLESIGLEYPVFYRNDRDLRTLLELASVKLGIQEKELRERLKDDSLVAHNALDDVMYQIKLATECFDILTNDSYGQKPQRELTK